MLTWLWLVPILPFAGFTVLALFGRRMPRPAAAAVGCAAVGLSFVVAALVSLAFLAQSNAAYTQILWRWFAVDTLAPAIGFHLDTLSMLMMLVVTFVAFLIHLYSAQFMAGDGGYSRFFAYLNLFVGSMLVLVLADNLLLLYLGWEGVGLCSYLLIGFWYKEPANAKAAMKAFIVTRVGDVALMIALFLLFFAAGTLAIPEILQRAPAVLSPGLAAAVTLLLLGGAVGKSAQLPLQVWLPDAMAGPTPVSALIHAATMVTAGVYLIARLHALFTLAPGVQLLVGVVGAVTLLLAACSALTQHDLKRILAYSTISQIGYMFLALGVGAWTAAMFHFMTHAFFKSLLFLGAGVVIMALHEEHDIFRMGGLAKRLPLTYWTFLLGALSLAAFPFLTAGFYSKDAILYDVLAAGHPWLWVAGIVGAFLTALYSFRMIFVTFFGSANTEPRWKPGPLMTVPLVILATLAIVAGFVETPANLGAIHLFSAQVERTLPVFSAEGAHTLEVLSQTVSSLAVLLGIGLAWLLYRRTPADAPRLARNPLVQAVKSFWEHGWGFDWLYDRLFVRPFVWLAEINRDDVVDLIYRGIAGVSALFHGLLSRTQTGLVRWYAAGITLGAVLLIAILVLR
jgi:NADH-quinone oxidoreductase subunit L